MRIPIRESNGSAIDHISQFRKRESGLLTVPRPKEPQTVRSNRQVEGSGGRKERTD